MRKIFNIDVDANIGSILLNIGAGETIVIPVDLVATDNIPIGLKFWQYDQETGDFGVYDLQPDSAGAPEIRLSLRVPGENPTTPPLATQDTWTEVTAGYHTAALNLENATITALLAAQTEPSIALTAEVKITTDVGGPVSYQFPITLWKTLYTPPAP